MAKNLGGETHLGFLLPRFLLPRQGLRVRQGHGIISARGAGRCP